MARVVRLTFFKGGELQATNVIIQCCMYVVWWRKFYYVAALIAPIIVE